MKKIKIIVLTLLVILISGCENINAFLTPENVSKEMVSLLSKGEYEKAKDLLYIEEENIFIDAKSFEEYLKENELIIKDNKKIELVENSIKYDKNIESKTVKIRIDNNRIFELDTRLKNNKWYIELDSTSYDKNLVIEVPKGSNVKLNGITLDAKKYAKGMKLNETIKYINSVELKMNYDVYTIDSLLKGKYKLEVTNKSLKDIKVDIESNSSNYYENDEKNPVFRDEYKKYRVIPYSSTKENEDINKYVNNYLNDVLAEINKDNPSIDNIKKHYKENEKIDSLFDKIIEGKTNIKSYSEERYSNLKLENIIELNTLYYDDNNIIVCVEANISYKYLFKYTGVMTSINDDSNEVRDETKKIKMLLQVVKENNGYIIKGGLNPIPNVF